MNNKTIRRIKKYKKIVGCTVEQATIAIKYEDLQSKNMKKASTCPECGSSRLGIETDGAEYSCNCWVECSECGFTDETCNYEPLQNGYDFDDLLLISKNPLEYGYNMKEWKALIKERTNERKAELSKCS